MKACGAKTRGGTPCKRAAMPNGRCRLHGGASLSGTASATFIHGRYSNSLPARLATRYAEAQSDDNLLALREEIALTDARLADVLSRVDRGDSTALWKQTLAEFQEVASANALGLPQGTPLRVLRKTIESGMADWAAWDEVAKLLEQRRRLVESERKRLVEMQQMITSERAMVLIARIAGIIQLYVTDPTTLAAISAELGKLIDSAPPGDPEPEQPAASGATIENTVPAAAGVD
jgi:hypothetical protein